jgi:hypothetical protein
MARPDWCCEVEIGWDGAMGAVRLSGVEVVIFVVSAEIGPHNRPGKISSIVWALN